LKWGRQLERCLSLFISTLPSLYPPICRAVFGYVELVKNQINKAIKDFDTMPRFKSHLQHSLKIKSNKTVYSPEIPVPWYVSM
jgi:hypothetical protein